MNNNEYIKPEEAAKLLGVTINTLINWDKKGKIKCIRTKGNHRRFPMSEINKLTTPETTQEISTEKERRICYCRVSTRGQKEDLERQIEFFRCEYPNYEVMYDIGSGINFKRKNFKTLVDEGIKGNIKEIVVTHRDRLCRFGFDLIEHIISTSNGKIVVLNQQQTSPQEELVDDLISIITVFSSRLYGLRSHTIKKQIKDQALKNSKDKIVSNGGRKETTKTDDGTI